MKKSEMPEVGWVAESEIQRKIRKPIQKPENKFIQKSSWLELERKQ